MRSVRDGRVERRRNGLAAAAADDARREARRARLQEGEAMVLAIDAQDLSWRAEQREAWARRQQLEREAANVNKAAEAEQRAKNAAQRRAAAMLLRAQNTRQRADGRTQGREQAMSERSQTQGWVDEIIRQRPPLRMPDTIDEQARARMTQWRCEQSTWSHPGSLSRARSVTHEAEMQRSLREQRKEYLALQVEGEQARQQQSTVEGEYARHERQRRWKREKARANLGDGAGHSLEVAADAFLSAQGQLALPATSLSASVASNYALVPRSSCLMDYANAPARTLTRAHKKAKLDARLDAVYRLLAVAKLSGTDRSQLEEQVAACERRQVRI